MTDTKPVNDGVASAPKKSSIRSIVQIGAITAAFGFVFWLGLGIGSGSLLTQSPLDSNGDLPNQLNYTEVDALYNKLRTSFDGTLNEADLMDGIRRGLVSAAGDPYTEFFNEKEATELQEQITGTFSGIGAELGKDEDGNIIIVSPIKGFPAEKAGLRAKDVIVSIDDESTAGMSIETAISKIRGEKGTDVTLKVYRDGSETKDITITRDTIKVPSVEYKVLDNNIGYIEIIQFQSDTADLVQQAAAEFKEQGVSGVIVDLRGNPGGLLSSAVDVSSVWLADGKKVLIQKRDGKVEQTYYATGASALLGVPTVVLIDEGSASASEIVAGALKDNKVATIVGQKSYGKGSVQDILPLNSGGQLKVTIARWHRPNGENIDKKGIKPDVEVAISEEDIKAEIDPQLDAAIAELQK